MVRSVARFGSALTCSSARAISTSVGRSIAVAGDCAPAGAASVSAVNTAAVATASNRRRISLGERTPELLLDIPGLEVGPAVQVHRKTRRNIERFDEKDRGGVRNRQGDGKHLRQRAREQ